nr:hypothetical protein [Alicyclobacillus sendaiensis]
MEIRQLYGAGVSISELARRLGHDRKTIRSAQGRNSIAWRPISTFCSQSYEAPRTFFRRGFAGPVVCPIVV